MVACSQASHCCTRQGPMEMLLCTSETNVSLMHGTYQTTRSNHIYFHFLINQNLSDSHDMSMHLFHFLSVWMPLISRFLLVYLFGLCMPLIATFLLVYIFLGLCMPLIATFSSYVIIKYVVGKRPGLNFGG